MTPNLAQLFLLSDHIKLSLHERQRAISLNLVPNLQNAEISRSLESFREGLEGVERQQSETTYAIPPILLYVSQRGRLITTLTTINRPSQQLKDQTAQLRQQYTDLLHQFSSIAATHSTTPSSTLARPNDTRLSSDFSHAQQNFAPTTPSRASKSVRFSDDPSSTYSDTDAAAAADANRAALFPYRDDEACPPDHKNLDNEQIHSYHSHVLAEQDDQLDRLGVSIGRQRELSIQIGDELDEQAQLLDDVDEGVERHQSQLNRARDRVGRLARKAKDNLSMTIILILIVILVLLIAILKT